MLSKKRGNIQAKKVYATDYTFDSTFEYKTYKILEAHFEPEKDLFVHQRILITPGKTPQYHIYQNIDFYIKSLDVWIEAKGRMTPEAKVRLAFLRNIHPETYAKIKFVTAKGKSLIIRGTNAISFNDLLEFVRTSV